MHQEQPAQAAGGDFAVEIGIVNAASNAITQLPRDRFAFTALHANGSLGQCFAGRARQRRVVLRSWTRRIEHSRSEISHGVLDDAGIKIVDCTSARSVRVRARGAVEPLRQSLASL